MALPICFYTFFFLLLDFGWRFFWSLPLTYWQRLFLLFCFLSFSGPLFLLILSISKVIHFFLIPLPFPREELCLLFNTKNIYLFLAFMFLDVGEFWMLGNQLFWIKIYVLNELNMKWTSLHFLLVLIFLFTWFICSCSCKLLLQFNFTTTTISSEITDTAVINNKITSSR